jgi:hypothetical protein
MLGVWLAPLVVSGGCSLAFVESPHVSAGKVECTHDYTLTLVDVAVAAAGVVTPFVLESARDRSVDDPNMVLYGALWVSGVVYGVSALIGMQRVKRCRRLEASMAQTAPSAAPQP